MGEDEDAPVGEDLRGQQEGDYERLLAEIGVRTTTEKVKYPHFGGGEQRCQPETQAGRQAGRQAGIGGVLVLQTPSLPHYCACGSRDNPGWAGGAATGHVRVNDDVRWGAQVRASRRGQAKQLVSEKDARSA